MIASSPAINCSSCRSEVPADALACPVCGWLVHSDDLKRLAAAADAARLAGDATEELSNWRSCLAFLPPESSQYRTIESKVNLLSRKVGEAGGKTAGRAGGGASIPEPDRSKWPKWLLALGPVAVLLFKFKFVILFLVTKAKLLVLGFTKAGTLFSMLLSFGVYWTAWGWSFAAGLIGSIYIHEMGHVAALRRFGIRASAPMFIPGLGAYVRMNQPLANAREDAHVGLAGPIWGLAAAFACYMAGSVYQSAFWMALARTGAWINLFNLLPVWQLDGSRAFAALSRGGRWLIVAAIGAVWFLTSEGLLLLLLIVAAARTMMSQPIEKESDRGTLLKFLVLLATLGFLATAR